MGIVLRWVMSWRFVESCWHWLAFALDDFIHLLHAVHQLIEEFAHGYPLYSTMSNAMDFIPRFTLWFVTQSGSRTGHRTEQQSCA